jgi:hypothetical protein
MLAGLQALQAAGLVHGHLWPGCVLITFDQDVKLADTGVGVDLPRPLGELVSAEALGYAAPERFEGALATPATDLYSLGLCLHFMLTGQETYGGADAAAVAAAVQSQVPLPLATNRPDLPPVAEEFVGRLISKDPTRRYGEVASVLADLERLKAKKPLAALVAGPAAKFPAAPPSGEKRATRPRTITGMFRAMAPQTLGAVQGTAVLFGNLETQVNSTLPQSDREKEGDELFRRSLLPQALEAWKKAWEAGPQHPGLRAKVELAEREWRKQRFETALKEGKWCLEIGQLDEGGRHADDALQAAESDAQRREAAKLQEALARKSVEMQRRKRIKLIIIAVSAGLLLLGLVILILMSIGG